MTDSDSAGFTIRSFLNGIVPKEQLINVYIPDIFGKEKRKSEPSKEGKLGVEGVKSDVIIDALKKLVLSLTSMPNPLKNKVCY